MTAVMPEVTVVAPATVSAAVAVQASMRAHNKAMVLALACAAQFMVVLDVAIVNVALPSAQLDLDVSQSTLQWVVIAYGLLLGGFLLLGGRMADLLGRRRILLTAMTIFSAASFVAGIAQSAAVLIAARGIQGFGAALVAPAALSIVAVTFAEGQERNRALPERQPERPGDVLRCGVPGVDHGEDLAPVAPGGRIEQRPAPV